MTEKRIIVIAGPNGAGKTTFAREFLPQEAQCPVFINADLIAAGLSPFAPESAAIKAGRLMLREMDNHAGRGHSFAFETILSGRVYGQRVIRRRYDAVLRYWEPLYKPLADDWMLFDNIDETPVLIEWGEKP